MVDKLEIDWESGQALISSPKGVIQCPIASPETFRALSDAWLKCGWQNKHVYTFTWMGRPVIQLPEDMVRTQEVLYRLQPDVIVETGIAHGGSLIYYASLCKMFGKGRVIGIDIEIRPHNRTALESHELFDRIELIEDDSNAPETVEQVKSMIRPNETVFVMLDGNHTRDHVAQELKNYSPLVTVGSYIVAADGLMQELAGLARFEDDRPNEDWRTNNPQEAARCFAEQNPDFVLETPGFEFNESPLTEPITYAPGGWLKRIR
ncbi:cephalosporin hydroxylase family protein [Bythopirellula polymerisocia]|uniref:Rhamnosyl O-methyltransferase n=1 Tax=Bythopirellula polymerisocia TaxID=2528003 RepID=A0A5C6CBQ9_9BACT|nr:CmcI family methyltransferase [Bythopirellula polymerisocia]TWU20871.1 Rhamnosyl O-methyltransferase precursor [Bythopirellula polymerisocia]